MSAIDELIKEAASRCVGPPVQLSLLDGMLPTTNVMPETIEGITLRLRIAQEALSEQENNIPVGDDAGFFAPPSPAVRIILWHPGGGVRKQITQPPLGGGNFV
jgi:hypothetical protein